MIRSAPFWLSDHFTLDEMLRTTRDVDGDPTTPYMVDNAAPPAAVRLMRVLLREHVERFRERWGPFRVTSGYRSPRLNHLVDGEPESAHRFGCAADLQPLQPGVTVEQVWRWLRTSGLEFDQAIWEISAKGTHWLHYGIARPGYGPARGMHFTIHRNER